MLNAKNSLDFLIKNKQKHTQELYMLDDLTKNIQVQNDEKKFLEHLNIFVNTYNALKQNHIEQGQRKLIYSLLNKLSKKLLEYIWNRGGFLQNNQKLLSLFESLEVIENERGKSKQNSFGFKWG